MICKLDYNKLSFAEFLLISNAIIYGDIRELQRAITKIGGERGLTRNE